MKPKYDLDEIKFAIGGPTFEKAVNLYENGKVTRFEEGIDGYSAVVLGTKPIGFRWKRDDMIMAIDGLRAVCYVCYMARINLGIILENLESELRRTFRSVVAEDRTNSLFREFRKKIKKDKTWYVVPDHLVEKD